MLTVEFVALLNSTQQNIPTRKKPKENVLDPLSRSGCWSKRSIGL